MIRIKPGVKVKGIQPEMLLATQIVASVYSMYNNADCVIVTVRAQNTPLHQTGYAVDFDLSNLASGWHEKVCRDVQRALGDRYDVKIYQRHLHVEYDPT